MARPKKSLSEAVSSEIKANFNLDGFKTKKGLSSKAKFKEQSWIPLSEAYQEITSVPGIPMGHIVLLRGHSDTGKTTFKTNLTTCEKVILPIVCIRQLLIDK